MIPRGIRSEERLVCTYGGALRPVISTVCESTADCSTRNTSKLVKIAGFVAEESQVFAKTGIS